jgi:hypothetical protein
MSLLPTSTVIVRQGGTAPTVSLRPVGGTLTAEARRAPVAPAAPNVVWVALLVPVALGGALLVMRVARRRSRPAGYGGRRAGSG